MELQADRPVALVVEDNIEALDTRKNLLASYGFLPIGASSFEDALREIESTPAIDIVVTDLNLDVSEPDDCSGIALARKIRDTKRPMPVVGISNYFTEDEVSKEDWSLFRARYPKGSSSYEQLVTQIGEWKAWATDYRGARLSEAQRELRRIKTKYRIRDADFEVIIHFLAGSHLPSSARAQLDEESSVDQLLDALGYELLLLDAGTVRPSSSNEGEHKGEQQPRPRTLSTIPLWMRNDGGTFIVEVVGCPSLYGHGQTIEEAKEDLLVLMDGFYVDLSSGEPLPMSLELSRLYTYLRRVFG